MKRLTKSKYLGLYYIVSNVYIVDLFRNVIMVVLPQDVALKLLANYWKTLTFVSSKWHEDITLPQAEIVDIVF